MTDIDKLPVSFSQGRKNLGRVKNKTLPWGVFKSRFMEAPRSGERLSQYKKLSDAEQKDLKGAEGYWMRCQCEDGRRRRDTLLPGNLVTLDFDYLTEDMFDSLRHNRHGATYPYFIHTSRRHEPDAPRCRLVALCDSPIPTDLYPAVSRILAQQIDPGMEYVDPVSFRPAQMMFMPTASKDSEYVYAEF